MLTSPFTDSLIVKLNSNIALSCFLKSAQGNIHPAITPALTDSMLERFKQLTIILLKYESLWKQSAFKDTNFSSLESLPKLKAWLFELTNDSLFSYQENDRLLLKEISPYFSDALSIISLIDFPTTTKVDQFEAPKFWDNEIPGRKAHQILAFKQALGSINLPLLEWCSGKQHLGRLLSEVSRLDSTGLEIDISLVKQANLLAKKRKIPHLSKCYHCDVLSSSSALYIKKNQHAIALHACGGLHTQLIQNCSQKRVERISFSPCCYHRFNASNTYLHLSEAAKTSMLQLTTEDLRLAVRETKTASMSETNNRRQLQSWRLGFDHLQRDLRQEDSYLETPTLSAAILKNGFQNFCLHLAKIKNVEIKRPINFDYYEKKGALRFHHYERAELFRMVFRRALESWLVLDRALYLKEQGYDTEIGIFCSPDISPRNFFIDARLKI